MSTPVFVPNDRVWVLVEDVWWPAKVLDPADLELYGTSMPGHVDYAVMFYASDPTQASMGFAQRADVEAFEDSSVKAVTSDQELKGAIAAASQDESANPLRVVAQSLLKRPAVSGQTNERAQKSRKQENGKTAAASSSHLQLDNGDGEEDSYPRDLRGYQYADTSLLLDVQRNLRAAVDASDLAGARKQLLRLDRKLITREQLASTKVGVAIGDILGNKSLEKLWALARGLINWFILSLPKATLEAIQNYRQVSTTTKAELAAAKETVLAAAVAAEAADESSRPVARATTSSLMEKVISTFQADAASISFAGNVKTFVEKYFAAIRNEDARRTFLMHMTKPGLSQLRRQMLEGSLSSDAFSKLPENAFTTDDENYARDAKIKAMIAAQEEEDKQNAVGTTMFECPNCKKKNATYHEQQTRGADEPTTKFVRCLECKHNWTTE